MWAVIDSTWRATFRLSAVCSTFQEEHFFHTDTWGSQTHCQVPVSVVSCACVCVKKMCVYQCVSTFVCVPTHNSIPVNVLWRSAGFVFFFSFCCSYCVNADFCRSVPLCFSCCMLCTCHCAICASSWCLAGITPFPVWKQGACVCSLSPYSCRHCSVFLHNAT